MTDSFVTVAQDEEYEAASNVIQPIEYRRLSDALDTGMKFEIINSYHQSQ